MEGSLYPWRTQKIIGHYTTYEDLLKPLPNPPDGLMWVKKRIDGDGDKDGCSTRWELVERLDKTEQDKTNGQVVEEETNASEDGLPDFIEHTVMESDTVAGLRLRYKVTIPELRKYNDFCGEQFHLCKVLRIPVQGRENHIVKYRQKPTKEVIRQRFMNATRCEDVQMQTYYLESNDYDLDQAIAEYEEDKLWEQQNSAKQKIARIPSSASLYLQAADALSSSPSRTTTTTTNVSNKHHRGPYCAPSPAQTLPRRPRLVDGYHENVGPPPTYRSIFGFGGGKRRSSKARTTIYNMRDFASSEGLSSEITSDFVRMEEDHEEEEIVALIAPSAPPAPISNMSEDRVPLLARQL